MKVLIALLVALLAVAGGNGIYVTAPALSALRQDDRNAVVTMVPHLRYGIDPTTLVIDLLSIRPEATIADVTRALFMTAQSLTSRDFNSVHLAYRGATRFVLPGSDFKSIGADFATENPLYLTRTLPEKLAKPNGERAFETWSGGVFAVTAKQLEDYAEMHRQWYLNDYADGR